MSSSLKSGNHLQLATLCHIRWHNVLSRHAGEVNIGAAAFADGYSHQAIDVLDKLGAIEGGGVLEVVVVVEGDAHFAQAQGVVGGYGFQ